MKGGGGQTRQGREGGLNPKPHYNGIGERKNTIGGLLQITHVPVACSSDRAGVACHLHGHVGALGDGTVGASRPSGETGSTRASALNALEKCFDLRPHVLCAAPETLDRLAVPADQKLAVKVPHHMPLASRLALEKSPHRVNIRAVDIDLGHGRPTGTPGASAILADNFRGKLPDLLVRVVLLVEKLARGKGHDVEVGAAKLRHALSNA